MLLRDSLISLVAVLAACDVGDLGGTGEAPYVGAARTPAEGLRSRLTAIQASDRIAFGMQRFDLTGVDASGAQWIGSEGSLDRSDVRTLVGAHPAMLGVDVSAIRST